MAHTADVKLWSTFQKNNSTKIEKKSKFFSIYVVIKSKRFALFMYN